MHPLPQRPGAHQLDVDDDEPDQRPERGQAPPPARSAGAVSPSRRSALGRVLVVLAAAGALSGQTRSGSQTRLLPPAAGRAERRTREVIESGLRYLSDKQEFRSGRIGSLYPVATTALSGLAVLGAGIQPDQPPYDVFMEGAIRYLLESADRDGYISESDRGAESDSGSRMHGHCYAVLFLTQVVGSLSIETERKVGSAIERGVAVIERSQSREGGWWYTSTNREKDEASVTICAVQALRAARNTGFVVRSSTIDRGVRYVKRCQNLDGSFRYSLSENDQRSTFALTAAAVSTLNAAGVYRAPKPSGSTEALHRGIDSLRRTLREYERHPERAVEEQFFFYGNFYAAQALFQEGGPLWRNWYERVRENFLDRRALQEETRSDGNRARWRTTRGEESRYGNEYATAMAILVLEIPLGYLPIFQR